MSAPVVKHWLAGDSWNATNLNTVTDQINWLRNPPMVHVRRRLTNQSITGGASIWTKVVFDQVVNSYDPYGFYVGAADTVTITEPGWYSCEIYTSWSSFAAVDSRVIMGLYKNGFTNFDLLLRNDKGTQPSASSNINMRKEGTYFFNVGDFMHLGVYTDDSSTSHNLAVTSDAECSGLRIRWVSN